MREASADGTAIADGEMGHVTHRLVQDRKLLCDEVGCFQNAMPRQRADADFVAIVADIGEIRNSIDINQDRRPKQPKVKHRHQALAAGNDLAVAAGIGQRLDCGLDAVRSKIIEWRRLHAQSPLNAGRRFSANASRASR